MRSHAKQARPLRNRVGRREFLRRTMLAGAMAGVASNVPLRALAAECTVADLSNTLVNFMLQGGADLRYLFVPAPDHPDGSYRDLLWAARRPLYNSDYASYRQMFDNEYVLTTDPNSGLRFGIYRRAGWLQQQFEQGKVAVVANAYCSRNRRHDQSVLNADAGEPDLEVLNFDRSGWGGRLVEYLGSEFNSVELANSVSTFNKGSAAGARLEQVVHAQDMRDMALSSTDNSDPASRRNILARALGAYYDARGREVATEKPANWPYHAFFQHHSALRAFGASVAARLENCAPLPEELTGLELGSEEFTQQCRNLFDVAQAPDVLGLGVVSMAYGGWDTHNNEAAEIGGNLEDIFGEGAGLDTTLAAIGSLPYLERPAAGQLVFYFASDFGRQLMANGAAGTDHGRGTYSLLIGDAIRGGIYGEMFPQREAQPDGTGRVPLQTPGADTEGLTSTERILEAAANWVREGAGSAVFPDAAQSGLEPGVDLGALLRA